MIYFEVENSPLYIWIPFAFFSGKSTALTRKSSNASDDNTTESGNSERGSSIAFKNITMAREEDSDTSESHHLPGKFDIFILNTNQLT